jgi:hypothetical protein
MIRSPIDDESYPVRLDLLCSRDDDNTPEGYHGVQNGLNACTFKGLNIAFDFNFIQEIYTQLPDNGFARSNIHVIDLVGSFTLKGQTIIGRLNEKDYYDIFSLSFYNGDPTYAAEYYVEKIHEKKPSASILTIINESFSLIQSAFSSPDEIGPFQVEKFDPGYNRFVVFAQMNKFFKEIETGLAS